MPLMWKKIHIQREINGIYTFSLYLNSFEKKERGKEHEQILVLELISPDICSFFGLIQNVENEGKDIVRFFLLHKVGLEI